jgi:hypothetical protein
VIVEAEIGTQRSARKSIEDKQRRIAGAGSLRKPGDSVARRRTRRHEEGRTAEAREEGASPCRCRGKLK